ncbi:hypothetical protein QQ045_020536 [Rhodiola kirilowii]
MMVEKGTGRWREAVAFAVMVLMEGLTIVLTVLAKTVMTKGMSPFVFVFYSTALSSIILLPHTYTTFQNKHRTQHQVFTPSLLVRFFFLGLTGITIPQNLAFTGLNYTSPILVCAMGCLLPSFSFILSLLLRKTGLHWDKSHTQAKIIGATISIVGGIFVVLYKGPLVRESSSSSSYLHRLQALNRPLLLVFASMPEHWALGGVLLALSFFSISVWNVIQSGTLEQYPEVMKVTSFYSLMGTVQCAVVSLIAERDITAWKLKLNTELPLVIVTACFGSLIRSRVHLWGMRTKGPFYVPMFRPFGIIFATSIGLTLFAKSLHFGSVLGTFVIGMGYFTVMWGTVREEDERRHGGDTADADQYGFIEDTKMPLLTDEEDSEV